MSDENDECCCHVEAIHWCPIHDDGVLSFDVAEKMRRIGNGFWLAGAAAYLTAKGWTIDECRLCGGFRPHWQNIPGSNTYFYTEAAVEEQAWIDGEREFAMGLRSARV